MNKNTNPTITIAIPARNETKELAHTLDEIRDIDYEKIEVIVLDDCSQDKTPQIIKDYAHKGVRFIEGKTPPLPWLGKNYAMQQLASQASGEYILFTDADSPVSDELIKLLLAKVETNDSLLVLEGANTYVNYISQSVFQPWLPVMYPANLVQSSRTSCWLVKADVLDLYLSGEGLDDGTDHRSQPDMAAFIHGALIAAKSYTGTTTRQSLAEHFIPNKYFSIKKNHRHFTRSLFPSHHHSVVKILLVAASCLVFSLMSTAVALWPLYSSNIYLLYAATPIVLLVAGFGAVRLFDDGAKPLSKKVAMSVLRIATLPLQSIYYSWLCVESLYRHKTGRATWRGRNICFAEEKPSGFKKS